MTSFCVCFKLYVGKSEWPELLGAQGQAAERTIERENHIVNAVIVVEGTQVTDDFRCDRVRVWVNDYNSVTQVPRIG